MEVFEWSGWLSSCGQINERQYSNARAIHSLKTAVNIVQFYTYKSKFQLAIISPTADETICFCICNLIESPTSRVDVCLFVCTAN